MGFRFRKNIRLAPGVRLNSGKQGMSISAGVDGASVTLGSRGTYANMCLVRISGFCGNSKETS
jgi:uncharacterized protein DUF4236